MRRKPGQNYLEPLLDDDSLADNPEIIVSVRSQTSNDTPEAMLTTFERGVRAARSYSANSSISSVLAGEEERMEDLHNLADGESQSLVHKDPDSGDEAALKPGVKQSLRRSLIYTCIAVLLAVIVLVIPIFDEQHQKEQRCLALVLFSSAMWVTEAVPLWVTSLSIPFLTVLGRVGVDDDLTPKEISQKAIKNLADPTVMLILGGFTLARALHRYHIDRRLAMFVLVKAGTKPFRFLVTVMFLAFFLSMWISNVAAPVLVFFLLSPTLHSISDVQYTKCLILGVAMACNIGGMTNPIASPQNAIAVTTITDAEGHIEFFSWILFATPICFVLMAISITILWIYFKPTLESIPKMSYIESEPFTWKHYYILFVMATTTILWVTFVLTEEFFCHLGVIGLIPVLCYFSIGILDKDDLNSMDWHILLLLGGGVALGDAVKSSGLLVMVADGVKAVIGEQSERIYFIVFGFVIMVITNFISHTVGAITMLPFLSIVGTQTLSSSHSATILILGGVLFCTAASALPVSSFPNVIAYSITDAHRKPLLNTMDYVKTAFWFQIFTFVVMITMGYYLLDAVIE